MQRLVVKIGTLNSGSQALFKLLGFVEESRSEVFNEVTMACQGSQLDKLAQLQLTTQPYLAALS